jgi:hypothetical protein
MRFLLYGGSKGNVVVMLSWESVGARDYSNQAHGLIAPTRGPRGPFSFWSAGLKRARLRKAWPACRRARWMRDCSHAARLPAPIDPVEHVRVLEPAAS